MASLTFPNKILLEGSDLVDCNYTSVAHNASFVVTSAESRSSFDLDKGLVDISQLLQMKMTLNTTTSTMKLRAINTNPSKGTWTFPDKFVLYGSDSTDCNYTSAPYNTSFVILSSDSLTSADFGKGKIESSQLLQLNMIVNMTTNKMKLKSRNLLPSPGILSIPTWNFALNGTESVECDYTSIPFTTSFLAQTSQSYSVLNFGKGYLEMTKLMNINMALTNTLGKSSLKTNNRLASYTYLNLTSSVFNLEKTDTLGTTYISADYNITYSMGGVDSDANIDYSRGLFEFLSTTHLNVTLKSKYFGSLVLNTTDDKPSRSYLNAKTGQVTVDRSRFVSAIVRSTLVSLDFNSTAAPSMGQVNLDSSTGDISVDTTNSIYLLRTLLAQDKELLLKATGLAVYLKSNSSASTTAVGTEAFSLALKRSKVLVLYVEAKGGSLSTNLLLTPFDEFMVQDVKAIQAMLPGSIAVNSTGDVSQLNIGGSGLNLEGKVIFSSSIITKDGTSNITSSKVAKSHLTHHGSIILLENSKSLELSTDLWYRGRIVTLATGSNVTFLLDHSKVLLDFDGANTELDFDIQLAQNWGEIASDDSRKRTTESRNITLSSRSLEVQTSLAITIQYENSTAINVSSIVLHLKDSQNGVWVEGNSTLPIIHVDDTASATITAIAPTTMLSFPSNINFNWVETTFIMAEAEEKDKEVDHSTCIQPRVTCVPGSWAALAASRFETIPCHSVFSNATCALSTSVQVYTNNPVECFIADPEVVSGWHVTVAPAHSQTTFAFADWTKPLLLFVFTVDLVVVTIPWIFFGTIIFEGCAAFAVTALMWKATTNTGGWSAAALSIVHSANYIFIVWWKGGSCELTNLAVNWVLVFLAVITMIILITYKQTEPASSKVAVTTRMIEGTIDWAVLLRGAVDIAKRCATALGIFWLAPPIFAYLPTDGEVYSSFILVTLLVSIIILLFGFGQDAFLVPGWIHKIPPGELSFAVWPRYPLSYAVIVLMLAVIIVPGIVLHFSVSSTMAGAVVLLMAFSVLSVARECIFPCKTDGDKKWRIASFFIAFLGIIFGLLFVFIYHFKPGVSNGAFLACWLLWAFVLPLFYPVREIFRYRNFTVEDNYMEYTELPDREEKGDGYIAL